MLINTKRVSMVGDELEPVIAMSARKHAVADEDALHAYKHPIKAYDMDEGLMMVIGSDRAGRLLEVGVASHDDGTDVIVHAMEARPKFLRRL